MSQTVFQNGAIVEILTAQGISHKIFDIGSGPLKYAKAIGSVNKTYDKNVKGYIFLMDSSSNSKLQFPKDDKQSFSLMQPFLVLQIYLIKGKSFTLELTIQDNSRTRKRLMFTTGTKEISINPLHAKIPLNYVLRNVWLNLSIDLSSFCTLCFKGSVYRSVETIAVSSYCKVRKIFTMRGPILDVNKEQELTPGVQFEILPKSVEFPLGISFSNQVYSADKIGIDNTGEDTLAIYPTQMLVEGTKVTKTVQLAFGTRTGKMHPKPEDKKYCKIDEGALQEPIKEPFKTQHMITKAQKTTPNKKNMSNRNKTRDQINVVEQRSSDVKITYTNTIEFKLNGEDNTNKESTPRNAREISEPPRQSSLQRGEKCSTKKDRSKDLHKRRNTKSPPNRSKENTLRPPGNLHLELKNQRLKDESSKNAKAFKISPKSSEIQPEDESKANSNSKNSTTKYTKSISSELTDTKSRTNDVVKNQKEKEKKSTKTKKGSEVQNETKKPINARNNNKVHTYEKHQHNQFKINNYQKIVDEEKDKLQQKSNTVFFDEPAGGVHLNSFNVGGWQKVESEKEKEVEIEEAIEDDDKVSHISHKDSLRDPIDQSPLY